jgi:hypothetical protein
VGDQQLTNIGSYNTEPNSEPSLLKPEGNICGGDRISLYAGWASPTAKNFLKRQFEGFKLGLWYYRRKFSLLNALPMIGRPGRGGDEITEARLCQVKSDGHEIDSGRGLACRTTAERSRLGTPELTSDNANTPESNK